VARTDSPDQPSRGTLTAPEYAAWLAERLAWRPSWDEYREWVRSHPEPTRKTPKLKGVET
jgi:hypothetical protein